MQPATSSPNYLSRNKYGYCFRIRIPKDLQSTISKKELRYSIGTGILSEAKAKARYLAGQFQLLFRKIRHMNLTEEQINQLIKEYRDSLYEHWNKPLKYNPANNHPDALEMEKELVKWHRDNSLRQLHTGAYDNIQEDLETALLNKYGFETIDRHSPEYAKLCHGFLRAEIDRFNLALNELDGDYDSSPTTIKTIHEPADQSPLLSEFIEKFPTTKPKWGKPSHDAYKSATRVMLKILGDIPVGTITKAIMMGYQETLAISPSYWLSRHPKVEVKDLPVPGLDTIGSKKFDNNLIYVGQLMRYAVDCGYLDYSPMPQTSMSLPEKEKHVHMFNDDQVKTILDATAEFDDHRYWLAILGLYTGCRANELCQLHKEDLKEKDSIWYLDINDNGKKTLKNKPSKRLVPLHSAVIGLGFVEYVKTVKHHRIFPGCKYRKTTGKYANNFGQWFNRLLVSTGIKEQGDRYITFQSFRHRAETILKRLEINNEHIDQIIGHGYSETKNPTYHHGYLLPDLKADIDRIPDHRTL